MKVFQTLILVVSLLGVLENHVTVACDNSILQSFGTERYNPRKSENCTWTFVPPENRTDLMLILRFTTLALYTDGFPNNVITLPDGTVLPKMSRINSNKKMCTKYIAKNMQTKECNYELASSYCPLQNNRTLDSWPPKLRATTQEATFRHATGSFYLNFYFDYLYIPCTESKLPSPPSTEMEPIQSTGSITAAIVLGILLIIVVVAFVLFALKCRNNRKLPNKQRHDYAYVNVNGHASQPSASFRNTQQPERTGSGASRSKKNENDYVYAGPGSSPYLQPLRASVKQIENGKPAPQNISNYESPYNMIPEQESVPNVLYHTYNDSPTG
ncbi:uncharacterized protein LOC143462165 [Clavelina lepadiformis]|uniref:uncharacterized protein LOC143462165 n=1 Tax=Clavelina lepadiformis TaxID=159417 RepID=UPI0040432A35